MRDFTESIPANIGEGYGRNGDAELTRFFRIAMGSASELGYHLLLAHDLGFLINSDYDRLENDVIEVQWMLGSFIQKLTAES